MKGWSNGLYRSWTDISRATHSVLWGVSPQNCESQKTVSDLILAPGSMIMMLALRNQNMLFWTITKFKPIWAGTDSLLSWNSVLRHISQCTFVCFFAYVKKYVFLTLPTPRTLTKVCDQQGCEGLGSWRLPGQRNSSAVCLDFLFPSLGDPFTHCWWWKDQ